MVSQFPELDFQHLLAHTFPGFFLAITLFMLVDFWSPYNLTSMIQTPEGLVSFAGFILIIGTILGIILDGIHHLILEDGIFSNLGEVEYMRQSMYCLFPDHLKPFTNSTSTCASFLTPHDFLLFFYRNMNEVKGTNVMEVDRELVFRYYRYSEFFSNTFLSLTVFSVAVPLYLFKEMEIKWNLAITLGIISLVIAMLCFEASHLAYIRYIKAQISFLCGMTRTSPFEKCIPRQGIPMRDPFWDANCLPNTILSLGRIFLRNWINAYNIIISILFTGIFIAIDGFLALGFTLNAYVLFFLLVWIFSPAFRCQQKLYTERPQGKFSQEIIFSYLGTILAVLILMIPYPMVDLKFDPSQIDENISLSNNNQTNHPIIGSISITNLGTSIWGFKPIPSNDSIEIIFDGKVNNNFQENENVFLIVRLKARDLLDTGIHHGEILLEGHVLSSSLAGYEMVKRYDLKNRNIPIRFRLTK